MRTHENDSVFIAPILYFPPSGGPLRGSVGKMDSYTTKFSTLPLPLEQGAHLKEKENDPGGRSVKLCELEDQAEENKSNFWYKRQQQSIKLNYNSWMREPCCLLPQVLTYFMSKEIVNLRSIQGNRQ